jgi:hypothetical protein
MFFSWGQNAGSQVLENTRSLTLPGMTFWHTEVLQDLPDFLIFALELIFLR